MFSKTVNSILYLQDTHDDDQGQDVDFLATDIDIVILDDEAEPSVEEDADHSVPDNFDFGTSVS